VPDLDFAARGAKKTARRLAAALGGPCITLDEENQVYRVVAEGRQLDVAELQGGTIERDLLRRDFNVNAAALDLKTGALIDPRKGMADLKKRVLKASDVSAFREDPLRILRAFRLAAQLDFSIDPATLKMMAGERARILKPAGERISSELLLFFSRPGCAKLLEKMDQAGLLTALFPDLEAARSCAVEYYGRGGVLRHSLDTAARAEFLVHNLPKAAPDLAAKIEKALAGTPSWKALVVLVALLHDVAKPPTAKKMGGRLRFFGHDLKGADMAEKILERLRFSREQIEAARAIIAHHLRPGNLAASGVVTDKAAYRFFRDTGRHSALLLLVCWADHASYLPEKTLLARLKETLKDPNENGGKKLPEGVKKTVFHLQVVTHLLRRCLDQEKKALPQLLVDGHDVMKALKLKPGPEIGKILEKVREAQAVGKIATRAQALSYLKKAK
jgi:tRNA nucleotidyltransferase/poly(A) polymerase